MFLFGRHCQVVCVTLLLLSSFALSMMVVGFSPQSRCQISPRNALALVSKMLSKSNGNDDNSKHDNEETNIVVEFKDPRGPLTDGQSIQVLDTSRRTTNSTTTTTNTTTARWYNITRFGDAYYCSCPAWKFQKRPNTARTCKHINVLRIGYPPLTSVAGSSSMNNSTTTRTKETVETTTKKSNS